MCAKYRTKNNFYRLKLLCIDQSCSAQTKMAFYRLRIHQKCTVQTKSALYRPKCRIIDQTCFLWTKQPKLQRERKTSLHVETVELWADLLVAKVVQVGWGALGVNGVVDQEEIFLADCGRVLTEAVLEPWTFALEVQEVIIEDIIGHITSMISQI